MKKIWIIILIIIAIVAGIVTFMLYNKSTKKSDEDEEVSKSKIEEKVEVNWEELYLKAFEDGKIKGYEKMQIQFVDTDFDDIPELYYGYVEKSSDQYLSSPTNQDGLSTFNRIARISGDEENGYTVVDSMKGEITKEDEVPFEFDFLYLIPTEEYVWGVKSLGGSYVINSRKDPETHYEIHSDLGIKMGGGKDVIVKRAGVYVPGLTDVNASEINEEFKESFEKAVEKYQKNDDILEKIENPCGIDDWKEKYKEYITEKEILTPNANAWVSFVDVDNNGRPDMIYSYRDSSNSLKTDIYKYTEAGDVVKVAFPNTVSYGKGYEQVSCPKIRFGYIDVLGRNGWVMTSPSGQVITTDDFRPYDTITSVFYLRGETVGMSQYDKEKVCELLPEEEVPEGVGTFVNIDTTKFDEKFDEQFEQATGYYISNEDILNNNSSGEEVNN